MTRVLVLGETGMLGSMVAAVLEARDDLDVVACGRTGPHALDACHDDPAGVLDAVRPEWVVNAIGIVKPRIDARSPASIEQAIEVNARFPQRLAQAAAARDARVVHAATDCVFSGRDGLYDETAPHDCDDVYGQSKSLGEAPQEHVVNLRCSIIGPERSSPPRSLLGWLLSQPHGARLNGYVDHRWNGITTLHFAHLCAGIVRGEAPAGGTVHVVPQDVVTKAELLALLARAYGREDLEIVPGPSPAPVDRSLATLAPERNEALWRAAGYSRPPTIEAMVGELAHVPARA